MSTLDDQVRELVHGELDGTNTPSDSERLRQRLTDDEDLRTYYDQMKAVSATLSSLPDEEPPAELRTSILASMPREQTRAPAPGRWIHGPRDALRLGYAFAAGLLVAAAVLLWARPMAPGSVDVQELAGTMVGPVGTTSGTVVGTERVALEDIEGGVTLQVRQGVLAVELDLRSAGPVEIVATASDPSLRWQAVTASDGELVPVTASARRIALVSEGAHRLTLLAGGDPVADARIHLEFRKGGQVIHEMSMALGATQ